MVRRRLDHSGSGLDGEQPMVGVGPCRRVAVIASTTAQSSPSQIASSSDGVKVCVLGPLRRRGTRSSGVLTTDIPFSNERRTIPWTS